MVVTDLPAISDTWVWQENARLRSMCTMQAPHNPVPQPNLVPVSLRSSRITHNSGVAGGASVAAGLPFTMKFVAIASSPAPRGAKAFAGLPDHPARLKRLQWPPPAPRRLFLQSWVRFAKPRYQDCSVQCRDVRERCRATHPAGLPSKLS